MSGVHITRRTRHSAAARYIEVFDTETPQFSQIVSPYDALEEPVPIDDQALGPTIMLLAPP